MYTYTVNLADIDTKLYSGTDLCCALHKAENAGSATSMLIDYVDELHGSGQSVRKYAPQLGWH